MEDKVILYSYWRSSCSWRLRIALNLKEIPYEYRPVNLLKQEQRSEEYLKLNPSGLVPTLIIEKADGTRLVVTQSTAILEYLEEAYPQTKRLLPQDPLLRAKARAIYSTIACDVQPLQNLRILQTMEEPAKTAWGFKVVSQGLEAVERLLEGSAGTYCVGNQVTFADIALMPQLNRFGVATDTYPRIAAIAKRLEALPEFIAADGPNQPDHPKPVDSLGPAGVTVRADEEGFQDLDDYFSQEFENKTTLNDDNQIESVLEKIDESGEPNFIISQPVRNSLGPNEYTIPLKGESTADEAEEAHEEEEEIEQNGGTDYDNAPMMDDDYGAMDEPNGASYEDYDNEINFSPNITLRQPVPSTPTPAPKKKAAVPKPVKEKAPPKPKKAPSAPKINTDRFYLSDEFKNDEAHRHSRRNRIAPLEFWRGETVKYSVDEELRIPVVVGVVRRAKTPQKPKIRPSRPAQRTKQQPKKRKLVEDDLEDSGYTPDVHVTATVMDYDTHEEEERLLAISADQHSLEVVNGEQFAISTVFEEGTFLTAGILSFPPAVIKPSRNAAKHALVFYVINGVFQVTINKTSFVIGTGGQFIVPRGNHYQLKNLHDQDSKLHFCHCMDSREE